MFLKQESITKKLTCSEDIVAAINRQQLKSNISREKLGLEPINTIALIHRYERPSYTNLRKVRDLKAFYNFFTDKNFEFCTVVFSDLKQSFKVPFKDKKIKNVFNIPQFNSMEEEKITPCTANFSKLVSRSAKIKQLVNYKGNNYKKNNNEK